jgi:hypothetical protein
MRKFGMILEVFDGLYESSITTGHESDAPILPLRVQLVSLLAEESFQHQGQPTRGSTTAHENTTPTLQAVIHINVHGLQLRDLFFQSFDGLHIQQFYTIDPCREIIFGQT